MRLYTGILNIGGSLLNQVPKTFTAAEAIVLQTLHGTDALNKIVPTDDEALEWSPDADFEPDAKVLRTHAQERERLQMVFGVALRRIPQNNIDGLFGIASMPLPEKIMGVDDIPFARDKPKRVAPKRKPKVQHAPNPETATAEEDLGALVG